MSVGMYRANRRKARRAVAVLLDRLAADYDAFAARETARREANGDTPDAGRDDYQPA